MKKFIVFYTFMVLAFLPMFSYAQNYFPTTPQEYRSKSNPGYWANKLPYPGYWQQDVHYRISAYVDEKNDVLTGNQKLTYWNNSPDELPVVYFHLYQNAFTSGSYLDMLSQANGRDMNLGMKQRLGKGISVESVKVDNHVCYTETDNTILKVLLPKPLKPGASITFDISFKTYFDITASWQRMRVYDVFGHKHYNGAHWYPRIVVYDHRQGWNTDQHLGHEFYGNYGVYEVELNFSADFIVEATGILSNEAEVMPEDLRKKIDIANFKDKPIGSPPSVIIPYDSTKRKIWKFSAGNVHDFAFVADPTFRIGEVEWNGVKCIAIVSEPNAAGWQDAASLTARLVRFFSEEIGPYAYPKIVSADARSGMEYPMLTMLSGLSPDYTYIFAHEIAHNWFYGMVGNNETYHAALDEGFTQYLTVLALETLEKEQKIKSPQASWYERRFGKEMSSRYTAAYFRYLDHAIRTTGIQLNTHSDRFVTKQSYGADYRQVYSKAAVMLFNLEYVLGDELFKNTLRNYFNQWKFCHPYLEDFRSSATSYTKTDLSWFFDQWLDNKHTVDYAVKNIVKGKDKNDYIIKFKRKGLMQMPLDFNVLAKNDSVYSFYIPNTRFSKYSADDKRVHILPVWTGWNNLNKYYHAKVNIPGGIKNVIIDSSLRLADVNMLDNFKRFPAELNFNYFLNDYPDNTKYQMYGSPAVWWNAYDGLKLGFNLNGNYMNYKHKFDLDYYINSGWVQWKSYRLDNMYDYFTFMASYETPLNKVAENLDFNIAARHIDGLYAGHVKLTKTDKELKNKFDIRIGTNFRVDSSDLQYLMYSYDWDIGPNETNIQFNSTVSLGYSYFFNEGEYDQGVNFNVISSTLSSSYNYTKINMTALRNIKAGKLNLRTRGFIQYAVGEYLPPQSALYIAGANPEEMMESKFTRSAGFFPQQWLGYGASTGHFHTGGGLNLRGYAGYLAPYLNKNDKLVNAYRGNSGAAINAELEFDKLFPVRPRFCKDYIMLKTYLFGDAGLINVNQLYEDVEFADFRADAGVGVALSVKKWGQLKKLKPFTLRFDVPLFLSSKPAVDNDYLQFRWVIGVNRAF